MSNVIKAYSIRYKEEKKTIDVSDREQKLAQLLSISTSGEGDGFVSGLNAIALEESEEVAAEAPDAAVEAEGGEAQSQQRMVMPSAEEILQRKAELTEQEKEKLRAELEAELASQRDSVLLQAQNEANQLMEQTMQEAENQKQMLFEQAKKEGYESGVLMLEQEKERLAKEFEQKEQGRINEFEQMQKDLEPKATQVVIGLLSALTGVLLESKKGIVSHLVANALNEADHSKSFMIRVSKEDYEEVRSNLEEFRSLFEYEVTLEIVQDGLMKKGECMIETDSSIIDCSLGTQLEGLLEDLRLLSV